MQHTEITDRIVAFLREICLHVSFEPIEDATFLPGIRIRRGGLVVDRARLLYPGDLLHEAGHLAVMPERIRKNMNDDLGGDPVHGGGELMALSWSYAAARHLGLDASVVFHDAGYKGDAARLRADYAGGRYLALPLLQWSGLCLERPDGDRPAFPHMLHWLCPVDRYAGAQG